ncbi:hypothetical protein [Microvirga sp. 17 mud 1-3]|uniref:hypothetical protein n=1 Tax=Microvirga sp. 17 mud 1-3 TaxID=2082949 RepID=UPI000D6C774F|nr:hypothetical protein [Microvirga sp. 17 mud 1-3]AWM87914.1 hypothetical protein C4E04_14995 [Microvirga sp. 17 mud 1-3]
MSKRVALACLALVGALIAGTPAGAQPYYGDDYYGPPPGPRYAPRYRDMDEYPPPRRARGPRGQWDCNSSRCINMATGELWESTCNYRGCFPLRPARQRGYGW